MGNDEYLGIASTPADYELYRSSMPSARGVALRVWSDGVGGGSATRIDPRTSIER